MTPLAIVSIAFSPISMAICLSMLGWLRTQAGRSRWFLAWALLSWIGLLIGWLLVGRPVAIGSPLRAGLAAVLAMTAVLGAAAVIASLAV